MNQMKIKESIVLFFIRKNTVIGRRTHYSTTYKFGHPKYIFITFEVFTYTGKKEILKLLIFKIFHF